MKKLIAMLLALVLVMGLVACGNTTAPETTPATTEATEATEEITEGTEGTEEILDTVPVAEPNAATTVYNAIWEKIPEEERFFVMGGDFSAPVDGAPGNYPVDSEALASELYAPAEELSKVESISCLRHAMMANNFLGAVYHITNADDVATFVEAMHTALGSVQWLCGMPEMLNITVIDGEYVFVAYGLADVITSFETAISAAFPGAENKYNEAIAG